VFHLIIACETCVPTLETVLNLYFFGFFSGVWGWEYVMYMGSVYGIDFGVFF